MVVKFGIKDEINILNQLKKQYKAIRILNLKGPRVEAENLYKEPKIDEVRNIIIIANCWFVYNQLWKKLPENFSDFFTLNTPYIITILEVTNLSSQMETPLYMDQTPLH